MLLLMAVPSQEDEDNQWHNVNIYERVCIPRWRHTHTLWAHIGATHSHSCTHPFCLGLLSLACLHRCTHIHISSLAILWLPPNQRQKESVFPFLSRHDVKDGRRRRERHQQQQLPRNDQRRRRKGRGRWRKEKKKSPSGWSCQSVVSSDCRTGPGSSTRVPFPYFEWATFLMERRRGRKGEAKWEIGREQWTCIPMHLPFAATLTHVDLASIWTQARKHKRKSLFTKNKTQLPKGGNDRDTSLALSPGVLLGAANRIWSVLINQAGNQGTALPGNYLVMCFLHLLRYRRTVTRSIGKKYIRVQVGKLEFVECALGKYCTVQRKSKSQLEGPDCLSVVDGKKERLLCTTA